MESCRGPQRVVTGCGPSGRTHTARVFKTRQGNVGQGVCGVVLRHSSLRHLRSRSVLRSRVLTTRISCAYTPETLLTTSDDDDNEEQHTTKRKIKGSRRITRTVQTSAVTDPRTKGRTAVLSAEDSTRRSLDNIVSTEFRSNGTKDAHREQDVSHLETEMEGDDGLTLVHLTESDAHSLYIQLLSDAKLGQAVEVLERLPTEEQERVALAIDADEFFDACVTPEVTALNEAFRLACILCKVKGNQKAFTKVVKLGKLAREVEFLLELPSKMQEDAGEKGDTILYTSIISACSYLNDSRSAFKAYGIMKMDGVVPNQLTFGSLAQSCVREIDVVKKDRRLPKVYRRERVGQLMRKTFRVIPEMLACGVTPDEHMYNINLSACRSAGDMSRLFETWQTMKEQGIGHSAVSYNTALSACNDRNDFAAGLRFYQECTSRNVNMTLALYSSAIRMCRDQKRWNHAKRIYGEFLDWSANNDVTPNTISHLLNMATQEAPHLKQEYQENSSTEDITTSDTDEDYTDEVTFHFGGDQPSTSKAGPAAKSKPAAKSSNLLETFNKRVSDGDLPGALSVAESLPEEQLKKLLQRDRAFMKACKAQRPVAMDAAFKWVTLLHQHTGEKKHFGLIVKLPKTLVDLDWLLSVPRKMRAMDINGGTIMYTRVVQACTNFGDSGRAFEAYRLMTAHQIRPNHITFGALAQSCVNEMKQLARNSSSSPTYRKRVADLLDKTFAVLPEMRKQEVAPDNIMFNICLDACRQAGDLQRLLDTWKGMERSGVPHSGDAYATAISAASDAGDFGATLQFYEEFKSRRPAVTGCKQLYTAVIHACSKRGNWDFAYRAYQDMISDFPTVFPDSMMFASLMHVAAQSGQVEVAFALKDEMKKRGVTPCAKVYETLVGICARSGLPDRAAELYAEVLSNQRIKPTLGLYNAVVNSYGKSYQITKALQVLGEMREAGVMPTAETYGCVIHAAGLAGDTELAMDTYQEARQQGIPPTAPLCDTILMACLCRLRTEHRNNGTNLELISTWQRAAVQMLRDTLGAGIGVNIKTFNKALACLRVQRDRKKKDPDSDFDLIIGDDASQTHSYGGSSWATSSDWTSGREKPGAGFGFMHPQRMYGKAAPMSSNVTYGYNLYDDPAIALYEEAQRMSLVPHFPLARTSAAEGCEVDLRDHPPEAACVSVLTLLYALRRRSEAHMQMHKVALLLPVCDPEGTCNAEASLDAIEAALTRENSSSDDAKRSGDADDGKPVASVSGKKVERMLQQLKLKYKGRAEQGSLVIEGKQIDRWLREQPAPVWRLAGKQSGPKGARNKLGPNGNRSRQESVISMQRHMIRENVFASGQQAGTYLGAEMYRDLKQ